MPIGESHRRSRAKNIALAGILIAFVLLLYFGAMVRVGGGN